MYFSNKKNSKHILIKRPSNCQDYTQPRKNSDEMGCDISLNFISLKHTNFHPAEGKKKLLICHETSHNGTFHRQRIHHRVSPNFSEIFLLIFPPEA